METLTNIKVQVVGALELLDNLWFNVRTSFLPKRALGSTEHSPGAVLGKTCLVTGANCGIGLATASVFASRGANVILACRSVKRGEAAAKEIRSQAGNSGTVEVAQLDLASLDSVRNFAHKINRRNVKLDFLVCNAGIMAPVCRCETVDGLEQQFQVNYLSHWLLTRELLKGQQKRRQRKKDAAETEGMRVVMLSSVTHIGGNLNFQDLQARKKYKPLQAYMNSKLANLLAVKELERRFERAGDRVHGYNTAVAVHPGVVDTSLARTYIKQDYASGILRPIMSPVADFLFPFVLLKPSVAAESIYFAATAPRDEVKGKYIFNGRVAGHAKMADDVQLADRLWEESSAITNISPDQEF